MADGSPSGSHPIVAKLVAAGVTVAASLPDSWLVPVLSSLDAEPSIHHFRVAREEDGVAMAAGAALAGVRSVVVCQNAGLLASVNALAGITHHHQLPMLLVVAQRGGAGDGYFYHSYKERVTTNVLDAIGIPFHEIGHLDQIDLVRDAVHQAALHRRPVAVLMRGQILKEVG